MVIMYWPFAGGRTRVWKKNVDKSGGSFFCQVEQVESDSYYKWGVIVSNITNRQGAL